MKKKTGYLSHKPKQYLLKSLVFSIANIFTFWPACALAVVLLCKNPSKTPLVIARVLNSFFYNDFTKKIVDQIPLLLPTAIVFAFAIYMTTDIIRFKAMKIPFKKYASLTEGTQLFNMPQLFFMVFLSYHELYIAKASWGDVLIVPIWLAGEIITLVLATASVVVFYFKLNRYKKSQRAK